MEADIKPPAVAGISLSGHTACVPMGEGCVRILTETLMKTISAMLLMAMLAIDVVVTKQAISGFARIMAAHAATIDRLSGH